MAVSAQKIENISSLYKETLQSHKMLATTYFETVLKQLLLTYVNLWFVLLLYWAVLSWIAELMIAGTQWLCGAPDSTYHGWIFLKKTFHFAFPFILCKLNFTKNGHDFRMVPKNWNKYFKISKFICLLNKWFYFA